MGTTALGLPYPEPTDPVAAGADNIKALAQAVEARFAGKVLAYVEKRVLVNLNATPVTLMVTPAITLPAGRRILVTWDMYLQKNAPDGTGAVNLLAGFNGSAQLNFRAVSVPAPGAMPAHFGIEFNTATYPAASTFYVNAWTASGFANAIADASNPMWTSVRDIGPAI